MGRFFSRPRSSSITLLQVNVQVIQSHTANPCGSYNTQMNQVQAISLAQDCIRYTNADSKYRMLYLKISEEFYSNCVVSLSIRCIGFITPFFSRKYPDNNDKGVDRKPA